MSLFDSRKHSTPTLNASKNLPLLNGENSIKMPVTANKIDERNVLLEKAKNILSSFRKMSYKERLDYKTWNPELYDKLIELEKQASELPQKGTSKFEIITDAKSGEKKYYYKRN